MSLDRKEKQILAILFASGEPVEGERLAEVLEIDPEVIGRVLEHIRDHLEEEDSPFDVIRLGASYQMCTRGQYAPVIQQTLEIKRNMPLSQAAMEALAVVAYNQPVTKSFVEQVRGVDSSGVMNSLAEKGLIEEAGRLELPGRPVSYCVTANFLRCFGLESLEELPEITAGEESAETDQLPEDEMEVLEGQMGFEDELVLQ